MLGWKHYNRILRKNEIQIAHVLPFFDSHSRCLPLQMPKTDFSFTFENATRDWPPSPPTKQIPSQQHSTDTSTTAGRDSSKYFYCNAQFNKFRTGVWWHTWTALTDAAPQDSEQEKYVKNCMHAIIKNCTCFTTATHTQKSRNTLTLTLKLVWAGSVALFWQLRYPHTTAAKTIAHITHLHNIYN